MLAVGGRRRWRLARCSPNAGCRTAPEAQRPPAYQHMLVRPSMTCCSGLVRAEHVVKGVTLKSRCPSSRLDILVTTARLTQT